MTPSRVRFTSREGTPDGIRDHKRLTAHFGVAYGSRHSGRALRGACPQAIPPWNALARAVFFNRLGELRDRSFENQRHRASGLNLVVAAIVLWNTVYLERAVNALRAHGHAVDDDLLQHLSPLGWDHINLTGDYT